MQSWDKHMELYTLRKRQDNYGIAKLIASFYGWDIIASSSTSLSYRIINKHSNCLSATCNYTIYKSHNTGPSNSGTTWWIHTHIINKARALSQGKINPSRPMMSELCDSKSRNKCLRAYCGAISNLTLVLDTLPSGMYWAVTFRTNNPNLCFR